MSEYVFVVPEGERGRRIDLFVADQMGDALSRSRIQALLRQGLILVNGEPVKAGYKVVPGDRAVCRTLPAVALAAEAEALPLDILYEDQDLIVVNKARGMTVHPAPGAESGTLVNALLYHCGDLSGINGTLRPGIVHRIDKDTTGLLAAAKNDRTHRALAEQIKARQVSREYVALLHGALRESEGVVDAPVGRDARDRKKMAVTAAGKGAVTRYWVLERGVSYTLVRCLLETGRTHQIRVHMAYIRHPVVGDPKYGPSGNAFGVRAQMLHAWKLRFIHPGTGEELRFCVPPPEDMRRVLDQAGMRWKEGGTDEDQIDCDG
ncbi:MAG: RluA family pseudouridine synthase [Peptococcaceae bacterium]|nr:RluA family pseudouridine synthase [Peptococcaceae bacterium]